VSCIRWQQGVELQFIAGAGKGFTAAWRVSLKGKPLQMISTHDVGWFGAQAFIKPTS